MPGIFKNTWLTTVDNAASTQETDHYISSFSPRSLVWVQREAITDERELKKDNEAQEDMRYDWSVVVIVVLGFAFTKTNETGREAARWKLLYSTYRRFIFLDQGILRRGDDRKD